MKQSTPPSQFKNGWLDQLDKRTALGQVMQARYDELTTDLGGVNNLSYQQRSLIERSLWLEYWLSKQEQALAGGDLEDFNVGQWVQASNALQGLFSKLGLERKAKDPVSLKDLMQASA